MWSTTEFTVSTPAAMIRPTSFISYIARLGRVSVPRLRSHSHTPSASTQASLKVERRAWMVEPPPGLHGGHSPCRLSSDPAHQDKGKHRPPRDGPAPPFSRSTTKCKFRMALSPAPPYAWIKAALSKQEGAMLRVRTWSSLRPGSRGLLELRPLALPPPSARWLSGIFIPTVTWIDGRPNLSKTELLLALPESSKRQAPKPPSFREEGRQEQIKKMEEAQDGSIITLSTRGGDDDFLACSAAPGAERCLVA